MENGIAIAGTITVDYNKVIDRYAEKGMLSNILSCTRGVGGCVANTIINLAKIDPTIPLYAYGGIGNDENGEYVLKILKEHGINTQWIKIFDGELTAFTDCMTIEATGERTFFFAKGANRRFSYEDIDFDSIKTDMFHMGYALLMDSFDKEDQEYGTVMARTLAKVQSKGIKTSIDLVSVDNERYSEIVQASLKYCNYVIINEIEAGKAVNISPYGPDGKIDERLIKKICEKILEAGVKELVVIHAPQGGWAMTSDMEFFRSLSLKLPLGYIKGSVGAGDAFCAGMLYSIYKELSIEESLKIACAAAACNLSEVDSISGMKNIEEIRKLYEKYKAV
ncbi:carbohydrate kinase family protein [Mahella sp.]|uniref:carbohydrate kinase family protein n=1 Tax=Mahella sp. TaxID=2798721 RepID=UPI0025C087F5|nr:carbohydrate kinase family protein [Mahella sp.]MBZ4666183.1 PfkB domain protein [Mahella sp.]